MRDIDDMYRNLPMIGIVEEWKDRMDCIAVVRETWGSRGFKIIRE